MVEVIVTDEFAAWYRGLEPTDMDAAERLVDLLEAKGVTLAGRYSSAVNGVSFALRELRNQADGRPLRIFYAFDPKRRSVVLIGGNKKGDDRFYETMVRECERIWKEYLAEMD